MLNKCFLILFFFFCLVNSYLFFKNKFRYHLFWGASDRSSLFLCELSYPDSSVAFFVYFCHRTENSSIIVSVPFGSKATENKHYLLSSYSILETQYSFTYLLNEFCTLFRENKPFNQYFLKL